MRSLPRSRKHELMLLWCRTPMSVLVRKAAFMARTKVSSVCERVGSVLRLSSAHEDDAVVDHEDR